MKEIYELDVYRLAESLSDMIWFDFDRWAIKVRHTVGYQLIRSSDSISANLAEGYGRYSIADRKRFYLYARGSFEETKAWLRKLIRRKVVGGDRLGQYENVVRRLGPKLNAFINTTRN